jgi:predicted enzyme related to lactoylglutathione lyase
VERYPLSAPHFYPSTPAKEKRMVQRLNFFEIPVSDLTRATSFYETLLGTTLTRMDMAPGYPMAAFDGANGSAWLIQAEGYTPGNVGIIIYFDCNPDLQGVLDRVEAAGGTIEVPKTELAPYGWRRLRIAREISSACILMPSQCVNQVAAPVCQMVGLHPRSIPVAHPRAVKKRKSEEAFATSSLIPSYSVSAATTPTSPVLPPCTRLPSYLGAALAL